MSPRDAAKIFLGELLYRNASVTQRDRGLYERPGTSVEFEESVKVLKDMPLPPEDLIDSLPGGYMMYAAISAVKKW